MDSLTQIVLGAAVGEAVLGKKVGNKAMLWGAIAGTIPDLDVLSKVFFDPVTANELHRGFSHSIFFSVLFAPVFGYLIHRLYKQKEASWKGWSWLMFWGLFTHPLLDAHTTWGTQLFWPLGNKISYKNIFVVDPFYTIPFLIFLILAMTHKRGTAKRTHLNNWGLYISSAYMLLTLVLKMVTFPVFENSLKKQGIEYIELETKPTPLNAILWTANVQTEDAYFIGYYSLFDKSKDVQFLHFQKNHELLGDLQEHPLVLRLIKLSKGWYVIQKKDGKLLFNDLRFGLMGVNPGEANFVFRYELYFENNELKVREGEKEMGDIKPLLGDLFDRVLGNI